MQVTACAALCNLVLDFAPVKAFVVRLCLPQIIQFIHSPAHPLLVINGLWALKNLVYMADTVVKLAVLQQLPLSDLLMYV